MALHHSQRDIAATLSTVGHKDDTTTGPKGYPPGLLAANTYTDGDAFSIEGARAGILTCMTGVATGSPDAQAHVFTFQTSADGTSGWTDYEGAEVTLTGNEKSARVGFSLGKLPAGHYYGRVKVVVGFTGGTAPKQSVCAHVALGGYEVLPVAR